MSYRPGPRQVSCALGPGRIPDIRSLAHWGLLNDLGGHELRAAELAVLWLCGTDTLGEAKVADFNVFPSRMHHEDVGGLSGRVGVHIKSQKANGLGAGGYRLNEGLEAPEYLNVQVEDAMAMQVMQPLSQLLNVDLYLQQTQVLT